MTSVALVPAIAYGLCMDVCTQCIWNLSSTFSDHKDQFPSFRNDRLFIIDLAAEASPIGDEHLDINDTPLGCIIISSYQQVGMCGPHTILPVHRLVFPNGAEL